MLGSVLRGDVLIGGVLTAYTIAALCVVVHVVSWLHLLVMRRRIPARGAGGGVPVVTVQLPLYNEAPSVAGLLASVAALNWPADRLEIQVLDDSTDDTPQRVAEEVARLKREGVDIHHIRRDSREGFKAGALAAGLTVARGEVIAIFDADFRPAPGFLEAAIGWLDPDVGLVQARWQFTNRDASLLTRAQALHLDAHFALEQAGRSGGNLLMGFNGTAGVWRRACIEAAGGWEGDTLTEDLDLAYRAQLAGWRLRYVDDIGVDSELPEDLPAVRSQQHRWIRGGAQVARKLLVSLWRSEQPLRRRIQGTVHLLASSLFLPVLLICTLTPLLPAVLALGPDWTAAALSVPGEVLRAVLVLLVVSYGVVCWKREAGLAGLARLARDFPVYLALATAICLHNARAAVMGWTGPTGTFVRTPKRGHVLAGGGLVAGEVVLMGWSWAGVVSAVVLDLPSMAVFVAFQALAFTALCWLGLRRGSQRLRVLRNLPRQPVRARGRVVQVVAGEAQRVRPTLASRVEHGEPRLSAHLSDEGVDVVPLVSVPPVQRRGDDQHRGRAVFGDARPEVRQRGAGSLLPGRVGGGEQELVGVAAGQGEQPQPAGGVGEGSEQLEAVAASAGEPHPGDALVAQRG